MLLLYAMFGCNEGMGQSFSSRKGGLGWDGQSCGNKGTLGNEICLIFKREVTVKSHDGDGCEVRESRAVDGQVLANDDHVMFVTGRFEKVDCTL